MQDNIRENLKRFYKYMKGKRVTREINQKPEQFCMSGAAGDGYGPQ